MRAWQVAAMATLGFLGCPGFGDETLADRAGIDEVPTFEEEVRALLETRCLSCHGENRRAGAPNSFHTYDLAVATSDRILARAVLQRTMPPGSGLTDPNERAILEAWIAGGTPQGQPSLDAGVPDMEVPDMADTDAALAPPTWNGEVGPIMADRCAFAGCHGGGAPASNLDLQTYAGFVAGGFGGDLCGGGDPTQSGLIDRLIERNGLPLMPQGGPPLDAADIEMIEGWVADDCPEGN